MDGGRCKELFQCHGALREGAVLVLFEAIGGDECQKKGLSCVRFLKESVKFVLEFLAVSFGQREGCFGVFDFANVDGLVLSVDEKVNLGARGGVSRGSPRADPCLDCGNAERLLDLPDMMQAEHLKGQARPGVVQGAVERCAPEMFIVVVVAFHEIEIEQGIEVDELIQCIVGVCGFASIVFFGVWDITPNESALNKFL